MKQIYIFILVSVLFATNQLMAQEVDARSGATEITVNTGSGYINEVYWDFEDLNHTVPLNEWDIAFTTDQMDVSIIANHGNTVELFTYPNGSIDDWNSVDTTGMVWKPMYNSIMNWGAGAFLYNAVSDNQFDFGWGVYNMTSHNVTGDSIFIIKIAEDDFRKLAIIEKNAMANQWSFKYARLDGSDEVNANFDADDYSEYSFIHYSLANETIVEHEPEDGNWQLLFTRYFDYSIPYYVSGVLAKNGVAVQEVRQSGLTQADFNTYNTEEFSEDIHTIGSDWKSFNMGTYQYDVSDTIVYFVRELPDGDIWKLYFTGFGGSSTGTYTFMQQNLSISGIQNRNGNSFSSVYPNPAQDVINLIYDIDGPCTVSIFNAEGKQIYSENINNHGKLNKHIIDISHLSKGIYHISVRNKDKWSSQRFIRQ